MLHAEVSTIIQAAPDQVRAIYRAYEQWPQLFPHTIRGVQLICATDDKTILLIEHAEGQVINILTYRSPEEIALEEFKRRYDAQFINHFMACSGGTQFTLTANIALKGSYQWLAPILPPYIRWQMKTYVLTPLKEYAEGHRDRAERSYP